MNHLIKLLFIKRFTQLSILTISIFTFISCGSDTQDEGFQTSSDKESVSEPGYDSDEYSASEAAYREDEEKKNDQTDQKSDHIEIKERKLIREGWLTWRTDNIVKTTDRIKALTSKHSGYFSVENQYNYSNRLVQNLTVRIPSEKFDLFVEELSVGIDHFERKNMNVVDVTSEFIDVEARIKSKKEMELRYLALLQQARNVTEMLEIERNLGYLREDIESAQARLNGMSDRVAYSTLYLEYYVPIEEHQYKEDQPGFWSRTVDALTKGWERVLNFFINLIVLWPTLLIFALILYLLRKRLKRIWLRFKE